MVAYIDYVYIIIYIYILLYTFIILMYICNMCNYLYILTCIYFIFLSSTFPALFLGPGVPALHPATVRGLR